MPKYYSLCKATPSYKQENNYDHGVTHKFLYPNAGEGYLFYDSDGIQGATGIHKALWVLAGLYPDAKAAFVVALDQNMLLASFNTASFPVPARIYKEPWNREEKGVEWLGSQHLRGWYIENIRDIKTRITPIDYDNIYDRCPHMERMVGTCPCPRQAMGTCLSDTLFQEIPELADGMVDFGSASLDVHRQSRYAHAGGFEFVPGLYSVEGAFVTAVRPWDNYDFSLVTLRKKEFADRGQRSAKRNNFRKEQCANCIFHTKNEKDEVLDCGFIDKCRHGKVEKEMVEEILEDWLTHCTPFHNGSEGFTYNQLEYLMGFTGKRFSTREFVKTGTTMAVFAGFQASDVQGNHLAFRIVPLAGDLDREKLYYSYAEMLAELPGLKEDVGYPYCSTQQKLQNAVLATRRYIESDRNRKVLRVHYYKSDYYETEVMGVQGGRRSVPCIRFTERTALARMYQLLFPNMQVAARQLHRNPWRYPMIKPTLPPSEMLAGHYLNGEPTE